MTIFQQFLCPQNFVQLIFDALDGHHGRSLVSGGDAAIQRVIKVAAHGFARTIVSLQGLMSTPAVSSHIIRRGSWVT